MLFRSEKQITNMETILKTSGVVNPKAEALADNIRGKMCIRDRSKGKEPRPPAKVPKCVLSGKGCGNSKTTRMLVQKQPYIQRAVSYTHLQ